MKINWFSPLPPVQSGVARDTAAVLPGLAGRAEITVWTPQAEWPHELEEHARIRPCLAENLSWQEINAADATVYHLGNDPEIYGPIWRASQQHPGLVVLHELDLHEFFAGLVARRLGLSPNEYGELMEFHHGPGGRATAEAFLAGGCRAEQMPRNFPLTGAAIENATGVIVHTAAGCRYVRHLTTSPVVHLPLPAVTTKLTRARPIAEGQVSRLIMFGHLGKNRRIGSVLRALGESPHRERFHLEIYGSVANEDAIRALLDQYGLQKLVSLHGFVPEAELDRALLAGNLAINLRDPTMGETSSSQLRIWQAGLPSLVSKVGWYGSLPEQIVAHVHRETELQDLQSHLANLVRHPERYRRIGEHGRRYVEEHHRVEDYLDGVMAMVERTARAGAREAMTWMSGRAGRTLRPWFTHEGAGVLLPGLTQTIGQLFGGPGPGT